MNHLNPHLKALAKLLRENSRRHRLHEVFRDFCELAALALSNTVDRLHFDAREARYFEIRNRYEASEQARFPAMLAELVNALECGPSDALGELFMALELGDHWKGQFFTPYSLASLMAQMTVGDVAGQVQREGFITVNEPACGAGAMVIAMAEAVRSKGVNYQTSMHVTAQDIDSTAVHMAYVQLSLSGIPAIVIHGNTLTVTEWAHWATPMHVLGGWDKKLQRRHAERAAVMALTLSVSEKIEVEPVAVVVSQRVKKAEQLGLFDLA